MAGPVPLGFSSPFLAVKLSQLLPVRGTTETNQANFLFTVYLPNTVFPHSKQLVCQVVMPFIYMVRFL